MAVAVEARAQQAEHVRGVRGRRLDRDLDAAVAHRPRELATTRVDGEQQAEGGVTADGSHPTAREQPTLGELKLASTLEQRVEPVRVRVRVRV